MKRFEKTVRRLTWGRVDLEAPQVEAYFWGGLFLLIMGLILIFGGGCALPGGHLTLVNVDMRREVESETILETKPDGGTVEEKDDVGLDSGGLVGDRTLLRTD